MLKTMKNIYDKAVSFDKILLAHKKARRGKREKKEVILFELNLESEILRNIKTLSLLIVIGPKANVCEKLLVQTICSKYTPNVKISDSILNIH